MAVDDRIHCVTREHTELPLVEERPVDIDEGPLSAGRAESATVSINETVNKALRLAA